MVLGIVVGIWIENNKFLQSKKGSAATICSGCSPGQTQSVICQTGDGCPGKQTFTCNSKGCYLPGSCEKIDRNCSSTVTDVPASTLLAENPITAVTSSNGTIIVNFSKTDSATNDWVGIYRNPADPVGAFVDWKRLNDTKVEPVIPYPTGTVSFPNLVPGSYVIRYIRDGAILGIYEFSL